MKTEGRRQSKNVVDLRDSINKNMWATTKSVELDGTPKRALSNKSLKDTKPTTSDDIDNILTVNQYRTMESLNRPLKAKPGKFKK